MSANFSLLKIFTILIIFYFPDFLELKGNNFIKNKYTVAKHLRTKRKLKVRKFKSKSEIFLDWITQDNSSSLENIKIVNLDNNERGIYSKSIIQKGDYVAKVHYDKLITAEIAKKNLIINEKDLHFHPNHVYLSIFLLQEQHNPNSKWKNYIEILPKDLSNFPLHYNEKDTKLLEGTNFIEEVKKRKMSLESEYNEFKKVSQEFGKFSVEDYIRARTLVASRNFFIFTKYGGTNVLVPLADMLNHSKTKQTHWEFDIKLNCFVIKAVKVINENEEIFDSYGDKGNKMLFLHYGFLLENNRFGYNRSIKFDIPNNLPEDKKEIVAKYTLDKPYELAPSMKLNFSSRQLFSYLRLLQSNSVLTDDIKSKSKEKYFFDFPPTNIEVEKSMLKFLIREVNRDLDKFVTTLQEDYELQKNDGISYNEKNCLRVRIYEKEILKYYNDMANHYLNIFDSGNKETTNEVMKSGYKDFKSNN